MTIGKASNMLRETPAGFSMHRVVNREDWARARVLRHEALVTSGDVAPEEEHAHADSHDLAVNSSTFLLLRNGRVTGSTRASVSSSQRHGMLPAMEVFGREIDASVGPDGTAVEASLTVVDPMAGIDRRVAIFHLLKAHMLLCEAERADWLLAAVRDTEIGFYRRMLNMEILSGAESCPGMATPRVLMGLQYREQAALLFKRIPVLAVTLADEAEYATTASIRFSPDAIRQQAA